MANDAFTRINTYMPDELTGRPCYERFDVPTAVLQTSYRSYIGGSLPQTESFQSMIMTNNPELGVANLPANGPLNGHFVCHPKYGAMLEKLADTGHLVPVSMSRPAIGSSGARNPPAGNRRMTP